jgi:hypothetical protein
LENARVEKSADTRDPSTSVLAIEGLRAAHLSGFWTVAYSLVSELTDLGAFPEFAAAGELEVDGWLISAANSSAIALERAAEARRAIPHPRWRRFSEVVEHVVLRPSAIAPLRSIEPPPSPSEIEALVQQPLPLSAQTKAAPEGTPS